MIPLKDENRSEKFPFVKGFLIVTNCLVFICEALSPLDVSQIARLYGAIPVNLMSFAVKPEAFQPISPFTSVIAAMFLHGNALHLAGNMLYLWIFGDNVEDVLGTLGYVVFYLACGLVGTAAQILANPDSLVPTLGASGAIAGVMGAYVV